MGFRLEYRTSAMEMEQFRRTYQDRERFLACCRECPRYETRWSCPPLSFDVDDFLTSYAWVNLLCARIFLDDETIRAVDTAEKMQTTGWDIVSRVKLDLEDRLRALETQVPGSLSLSSGGCHRCGRCAREEGGACRQPEKMRYSLDAFGFDLTAITQDLFQIEILWCREHLPEYFTLIHGLLAAAPVPEEIWEAAGLGHEAADAEEKEA